MPVNQQQAPTLPQPPAINRLQTEAESPRRKSVTAGDRAFVQRLVRDFAQGRSPQDFTTTVADVVAGVSSWEAIDRLLRTHRCSGIAYRQLTQPVGRLAEGVPPEIVERLRARYVASFAQVAVEPKILHRLVRAFGEAGIPVLVTKGLAVGTWLYDDPALREHDDIDLLVPARLADAAHSLMAEVGYVGSYQPPLYFGEAPATADFRPIAGGSHVDLSFDPLRIFWPPDPGRDPFNGWLERRQELAIGGGLIPTLGPEDQFVQLARHLQFHDYFRANWFVDLLLLLRCHGDRLDWPLVGRIAGEHGLNGGLYRTLEIAKRVYDAEVPPEAWQSLRPTPIVRRLHRRIWPDTLAMPRDQPRQGGSPITPRFLSPQGIHPIGGLTLLCLDRNRVRNVRYLAQRVVPPPGWLRARYGSHGGRKATYGGLLLLHWRELLHLRRRVRENHRTRAR